MRWPRECCQIFLALGRLGGFAASLIINMLLVGCNNVQHPWPKACKYFKYGQFKIVGGNQQTSILREDIYQIEYNQEENYIDSYSIEWGTDCEYRLRLLSTTQPEELPFERGDKIEFEIMSADTQANRYSFIARFEDKGFNGEIQKVD